MESWRLCKFSWKCFHFWQCLGLPEWKPAVKKFWAIWTTGDRCSFYGKRCSACELQCLWFKRAINKDMGLVTGNANYNTTHSPSLSRKNKTVNDSRLLKNSEGNHMVSETSVEGGRHCFILASDKNKKDQKKSSKQTSRWLPHVVISQQKIRNGAYQ